MNKETQDFLNRLDENTPINDTESKFFEFFNDEGNQKLILAFLLMAQDIRKLRRHYRSQTIIEALRWNRDLNRTDQTFKINDHVKPYLARLAEGLGYCPEGFFRKRTLKSDRESKEFTLKAFDGMRHDARFQDDSLSRE